MFDVVGKSALSTDFFFKKSKEKRLQESKKPKTYSVHQIIKNTRINVSKAVFVKILLSDVQNLRFCNQFRSNN